VALGLSYRCECGKKFKIYLPKGMVYGEAVSRAVDWGAVDAREEACGEVEEVRHVAEATGCTFVDGRHELTFSCPSCASEVDVVEHFRSRVLTV